MRTPAQSTPAAARLAIFTAFGTLLAAAPGLAAPTVDVERGTQDKAEAPASCCTLPGRFAALSAESAEPTSRVALESISGGMRVTVGDGPFADYRTDIARQPVVWPLYNAAGLPMTRSFPLGPAGPKEQKDHPHHQSLWFTHGAVNGIDFWNVRPDAPADAPRIDQVEGLRSEEVGGRVVIETRNAWRAGGRTLLRDRRTLVFAAEDDSPTPHRWIDFAVELEPAADAVTLGDTKEGSFAVRVPGPMKVDARLGGAIQNSVGQTDEAAWGQPAEWVLYQGPLRPGADAPTGGLVIMSHPDSFRPVCRWHVRTYGLFAANPFGAKDFPAGESTQGEVTLEPGDRLRLRYRLVLVDGAASAADAGRWFERFAASTDPALP